MTHILRSDLLERVRTLISQNPVVAILGPRQCGKSTLARELAFSKFFDLENPRDWTQMDYAQTLLESQTGLIVIDEIQRRPELFALLRYLVDQTHPANRKFLLLGSASPELIRQSSETLAGRIAFVEMKGFHLAEVGQQEWRKLWLRGGFPRSFLAPTDQASHDWREHFISSYLERDIPQLGIRIPSDTLRRFWLMLSHYHAQILNYSELSRSFGMSDKTVRSYIDILQGTFMITKLTPWFENLGKRLVKQPKLYLTDSGIFHALHDIESTEQLLSSPKLGASWEGFALSQFVSSHKIRLKNAFFWSTHGGAEIDLLWKEGGRNFGAEFKFVDAPKVTKSLRIAMADLKLEAVWIIHPGKDSYPLDKNIFVQSIYN
ncbi:MAG: ATP-binding protein [Deltaproteobacteria bacterium]|nr:ATP-binding protein [Deltaproteobacteria bacterium]